MQNLLKETLKSLDNNNKKPTDIIFIGAVSGYSCTWKEFVILADKEYDRSFGSTEVAEDLIIVFTDGSRLVRGEYDGSEWWEYIDNFKMPKELKPIKSLFQFNYEGLLAGINS